MKIWRWIQSRLSRKTGFWLSIILTVVLGGVGVFSYSQEIQVLEDLNTSLNREAAASVERQLHDPILRTNETLIRNRVEELVGGNVVGIRVQIVFFPDPIFAQSERPTTKKKTYRLGTLTDPEDPESKLADVEVDIDVTNFEALKRGRLISMLRNMVITLGLIWVFLPLFLKQALSTPLDDLLRRFEALGAGDLETPVASENQDEVGRLAEVMEHVRAQLLEKTQQLAKAMEASEAAGQAKSSFIATMSHEQRTPLNAVIGSLELAQKKLKEWAKGSFGEEKITELEGLIRRALSGADIALTNINAILDYAKMERGELSLDLEDFLLENMLRTYWDIFVPKAVAKGIKLEPVFDENLPASIIGDDKRLGIVFSNLLGNAIKFTDRGSVYFVASHESTINGRVEILFAVMDTGIGIPPEKHEEIFRPFTQADTSTTRKYGGTGLGLTTARELIHIMGGAISVESQVRAGTIFSVLLSFEEGAQKKESVAPTISPAKTETLTRTLTSSDCESLDSPISSLKESLADGTADESDPALAQILGILEGTELEDLAKRLQTFVTEFEHGEAEAVLDELKDKCEGAR